MWIEAPLQPISFRQAREAAVPPPQRQSVVADLDPAVILGRLVVDLQEMGASTTPSFLECLGRCATRSLVIDDFGDQLLQDMSATSRDNDMPPPTDLFAAEGFTLGSPLHIGPDSCTVGPGVELDSQSGAGLVFQDGPDKFSGGRAMESEGWVRNFLLATEDGLPRPPVSPANSHEAQNSQHMEVAMAVQPCNHGHEDVQAKIDEFRALVVRLLPATVVRTSAPRRRAKIPAIEDGLLRRSRRVTAQCKHQVSNPEIQAQNVLCANWESPR
jgi:hypothetical protein